MKIKGQTVKLHNVVVSGQDPFGRDILTESVIEVDNVLVQPASDEDIVSTLQLEGKHLVYVLHIPKGDTHDWKDKIVEVMGMKLKTFGFGLKYPIVPDAIEWDMKVKCEIYE